MKKKRIETLRDPQKNFRLSQDGRRILAESSQSLGITETDIVEIALRWFEKQNNMLTSVFPGDRGNLYLDFLSPEKARLAGAAMRESTNKRKG